MNRFKALGKMLTINQRLHKLGAACANFEEHGMLKGNVLSVTMEALLQAQGGSNQEDPLENNNSKSAEVDLGLEGESTHAAQPVQASLPPDDNESPLDRQRVVGFVDMATTPRTFCISLMFKLALH